MLFVLTISLDVAVLNEFRILVELTDVRRELGQISAPCFLWCESLCEHFSRGSYYLWPIFIASAWLTRFCAVVNASHIPACCYSCLHRGQCFINRLSQIYHILQLLIIVVKFKWADGYMLAVQWMFAQMSEWVNHPILCFLWQCTQTSLSENITDQIIPTLIDVRLILKRSRFLVVVGKLLSISRTRN